ncbi:hypothetical protein TWF730_004313 [Orbilia blumenaviensis]|uniref:Uncharacterized protein n=1 Tax=Orbilia blumenaviensis TaxID=1796055 RepID=A0AAV9U3M9_9PEZI
MSSYQKTNPTKGTKTSANRSTSPKLEHSGAVLQDSLAADSLRSNGSFSKGNPTGILSVMAENTTLNRGDDTIGFRRVHESEDGGGHVGVVRAVDRDEGEKYETGGSGKMNKSDYDGSEDNKDRDKGFGDQANIVDKQPEIGSDEDPGRYAEKKFLEKNARQAGVPGGGSGEGRGGNMYEVLKDKSL